MSLKKCTGCNVEKELQEFSQKTKTKLHSRCKVCVRAKVKEHYQKNKAYYITKALGHNKIYINQNRQFVWDYLKEHPCVDCNESDPVVLEFDHLRDKDKDISNLPISIISTKVSLRSVKNVKIQAVFSAFLLTYI